MTFPSVTNPILAFPDLQITSSHPILNYVVVSDGYFIEFPGGIHPKGYSSAWLG